MSIGTEAKPTRRPRVARLAHKALGGQSKVAALVDAASEAEDDAPAQFKAEHRKAVPPEVRLALDALRGGDNWHSIIFIGMDWIIMSGASAAAMVFPYGPAVFGIHLAIYPFVVALIGSRQRGLMNLVHQASHELLFKNLKANRWCGEIFAALPLLNTVTSYADEHRMHHGWLWSFHRDPKTKRYRTLGLIKPVAVDFVRCHIVKPFLLTHVPFNVFTAIWKEGEKRRATLLRVGFWITVAAIVVPLNLEIYVLFFWIVPFLTSFQIIRYFTEMAEHAGLKTTNPWLATRSWTSSWAVRTFMAPHTDHYHLCHHLWSRIPHYRIANAHRIAMEIPEYAGGHHCNGFFRARKENAPSVVADILRPEQSIAGATAIPNAV